MTNLEFKKKFNLDKLTIFKTKHWTWSLRPHQITIGSGILSLNRKCEFYKDLTSDEHCDLGEMIKVIENTLGERFNYNAINYLMLMLVDSQVHYHVIPRYNEKIEFRGRLWEDAHWPTPPIFSTETTQIEVLLEIKKNIIMNLKVNKS